MHTTTIADLPCSTGCSSRMEEPWFLDHAPGVRNPPKDAEYSGFRIPARLAKRLLREPRMLQDLTDSTRAHYVWLRRDRYSRVAEDGRGCLHTTVDGRKSYSFAVLEGTGPDYYTVRVPGMDWILEVWSSYRNRLHGTPSPDDLSKYREDLRREVARFIDSAAA